MLSDSLYRRLFLYLGRGRKGGEGGGGKEGGERRIEWMEEEGRGCEWMSVGERLYLHTPSDEKEDNYSHCNTCEESYTEQHQDDRECNGLGPQGHDLTRGDQSCKPLQQQRRQSNVYGYNTGVPG